MTKQQVLGMIASGFLVITSFDREIEYLRVYGDIVIVAGGETVVWGGKMPNAGKTEHLRFTAVDETSWKVGGNRAPRQHCSCSAARLKSQPPYSALDDLIR